MGSKYGSGSDARRLSWRFGPNRAVGTRSFPSNLLCEVESPLSVLHLSRLTPTRVRSLRGAFTHLLGEYCCTTRARVLWTAGTNFRILGVDFVEQQAMLDAFLIFLNFAAFFGYGTIPLDVFFPERVFLVSLLPPGEHAATNMQRGTGVDIFPVSPRVQWWIACAKPVLPLALILLLQIMLQICFSPWRCKIDGPSPVLN